MVFALPATLIVSLVVALLAALQLGDFFRAGDELLAVLIAVAGFAVLSITILATGYRLANRPRTLSAIAGGLALAATALALWPGTVERIVARSGAPLPAGFERSAIALELLVPALLAVLVQWGLVRRRFLHAPGVDDLTLWPWLTTAAAGLAILNPIGLALVWMALKAPSADALKDVATTVTAAGAAVLVVMGAIECYIRGRRRSRDRWEPSLNE